MTVPASPSPTLWRTCRVLANPMRLRIFALLAKESPQTVSSVALRLQLSIPQSSQYLRALEARGLLSVRRISRRVEYRSKRKRETNGPLSQALNQVFHRRPNASDDVFQLCTAFTHPRRIEIFRTLKTSPRTIEQLRTATSISTQALYRHLRKLVARGYVICHEGIFSATLPANTVGRVLGQLAVDSHSHTL